MPLISFGKEYVSRMVQVLYRYITVEGNKILRDIDEYTQEDYKAPYPDEYGTHNLIDYKIFRNHLFEVKPAFEVEKIYEDEEEEEYKESIISINIYISFKEGQCKIYTKNLSDLTYKDKINQDDVIIWLKETVFSPIVRCGHCNDIFLEKNRPDEFSDKCESCYIYWYMLEDDKCCICHENEGVFIELNRCKHVMHRTCWRKLVKENKEKNMAMNKCPLCRKTYDSYEYSVYPNFENDDSILEITEL